MSLPSQSDCTPCVLRLQVVIPVVSVQLIKKHKTARLLPNGLAITTTASRKVLQCQGLPSCWGTEHSSVLAAGQGKRGVLLLFLYFTLFLSEANTERNSSELSQSLPGSDKPLNFLQPRRG